MKRTEHHDKLINEKWAIKVPLESLCLCRGIRKIELHPSLQYIPDPSGTVLMIKGTEPPNIISFKTIDERVKQ